MVKPSKPNKRTDWFKFNLWRSGILKYPVWKKGQIPHSDNYECHAHFNTRNSTGLNFSSMFIKHAKFHINHSSQNCTTKLYNDHQYNCSRCCLWTGHYDTLCKHSRVLYHWSHSKHQDADNMCWLHLLTHRYHMNWHTVCRCELVQCYFSRFDEENNYVNINIISIQFLE